ncbi:helix-turn-helix transcriptional regulator [Sphingomonas sp. So64.6b]|uniref:helix-turn-helix domain-containing protein n=1 Tax=Sphingomonas sp. So64.6b TaxID=2997354 RepID=UPI001602D84E|nr:helix-turn-helix transcriptional regulator [Sphingomonas sp. So64.6b]QNA84963.1 helix-turn-helix transcriptional regulator [Sphingomonas sp. So64.6b]
MADHFADRLNFGLKALSMSRGRLASELGVDKSLVGRWASGSVRPSAYNLERLTHFLAKKRPGLTLLDWERDMVDFAALFGEEITEPGAEVPSTTLSGQLLDLVRNSIDSRAEAYEGFWRTTHASVFEPGRFCQQHGIIRQEGSGGLRFELGADDIRYGGSMFPVEGQVFAIASDSVRHVPSFLILNVVAMPRIALLDGLLIAASSSLRIPSAYSIIFERIGDLSGNREADDAHVATLMAQPEFVDDDCVPAIVRDHLLRDFGPKAAEQGGEMMLSSPLTPRLAQIISLMSRPA